MKNSTKKGFSFGLVSGIITTLGLIIGLNASTHSVAVVVSGILVIAISDALSDAIGIHISEESENHHTTKEIWESTIATFVSKFIFALTFIIPVILFSLATAVIISVVWGLFWISLFSYFMAKDQKTAPYKIIGEHLVIAVFVIIATYYIGGWIPTLF